MRAGAGRTLIARRSRAWSSVVCALPFVLGGCAAPAPEPGPLDVPVPPPAGDVSTGPHETETQVPDRGPPTVDDGRACEPPSSCCAADHECPQQPCVVSSCDRTTGVCHGVPALLGVACDDGDRCTWLDGCDGAGQCAGKPVDCDDGLPCTVDSCLSEARGAPCEHVVAAGWCLTGASCKAAGEPLGNGCWACGEDGAPVVADGGPCVTEDTCHAPGSCSAGVCELQPPGLLLCEHATCEVTTGQVVFAPTTGHCVAGGSCLVEGQLLGCDQCTAASVMAPAVGYPCDDGDPCTAGDACTPESECAGLHYECEPPLGGCANAICDGLGGCLDPVVFAEDECLVPEALGVGGWLCAPAGAVSPVDPCAACQPKLSPVGWTGLAPGSACTPADCCQTAGACTASGDCVGEPVECDDGNPCSADECDPVACAGGGEPQCVHTPAAGLCTAACGVPGECAGAECVPLEECPCASDADCDDAHPCTEDFCSDTTCHHSWTPGCCATAADCGDCDPCTVDLCEDGVCTWTPKAFCCTHDEHCEDGSACTTSTCILETGKCQHKGQLCNDDNICSLDTCDHDKGCFYKFGPSCEHPTSGPRAVQVRGDRPRGLPVPRRACFEGFDQGRPIRVDGRAGGRVDPQHPVEPARHAVVHPARAMHLQLREQQQVLDDRRPDRRGHRKRDRLERRPERLPGRLAVPLLEVELGRRAQPGHRRPDVRRPGARHGQPEPPRHLRRARLGQPVGDRGVADGQDEPLGLRERRRQGEEDGEEACHLTVL